MARILTLLAAAALIATAAQRSALAQGPSSFGPGRPGFSPDRIFGFFDRNGDGVIDGDEQDRLPGSMRDMLRDRGGRPIGRDDFNRAFEERMRARREESDRDDDDDDDDRSRSGGDGDRSRSSGSSSRGGSSTKKERPRVTLRIPDAYKQGDTDGDGQLGLYEWLAWKTPAALAEFAQMDRNHDGFLTPFELGARPAGKTVAAAAGAAGSAAGSPGSTAARPAPAAPAVSRVSQYPRSR